MEELVSNSDTALLRREDFLIKIKPFSEKLVEYFGHYWSSHQWTQVDMDAPNKSPAELQEQSLPVFHGMVFCSNEEDQQLFKGYIKGLFDRHFMPFDRFWDNTLFNNSGEFTFIDLWVETRTIERILAGRTYDLIFLMKIEAQEDMISSIIKFTKDKDPNRIIAIR